MVFAVSTQVFENDVVSEAHLELFKHCGFDHIEIFLAKPHFDWHDSRYVSSMHAALEKHGLSVCSVHAPWMPGADIASLDTQERARSVADVKKAADLLQRFGGRILVIHPGAALQSGDDLASKMTKSRESLLEIARYCKPKGVQLALENPPKYELCGEAGNLLDLYQSLEPSDIKACFDTGHANISGGLELWLLSQLEKAYIHLHDNNGKDDSHQPPGSGSFQWEAFFGLLKASSFRGIVCLELGPTKDTESVLRASKKWFQEMSQTHGLEN